MSTVSISGAGAAVKVAVEKTVESVNRQVLSRATRAVNAMRNAELDVLKGQRGGRIYRKPGGGTYQASSPGEPPARRTGNLRLHWNGRVATGGGGSGSGVSITLELESQEHYAGYLENGTSHMAPRPFKDRITEKATPDVVAIYSEPYA